MNCYTLALRIQRRVKRTLLFPFLTDTTESLQLYYSFRL